jgi:hypothetical protein
MFDSRMEGSRVTYCHSRIRYSLARREVLRQSGTKNAKVGGVDTLCKQFLTSHGVPRIKRKKKRNRIDQGEQNRTGNTHFSLVSSGTITYPSKGSKKTAFSLACGMLPRQEDTAKKAEKRPTSWMSRFGTSFSACGPSGTNAP